MTSHPPCSSPAPAASFGRRVVELLLGARLCRQDHRRLAHPEKLADLAGVEVRKADFSDPAGFMRPRSRASIAC